VLFRSTPRFLPGPLTPVEALQAIESGFDIFEGTYAAHLTRQGLAATFSVIQPQASTKRRKLDSETEATLVSSKISLYDKSFALDQSPLLVGCECCTCKNHTRAYLHHLVVCQEMTANVLLDVHNIWHLDSFMAQVRNAIANDSLPEYSEWFCSTMSQ